MKWLCLFLLSISVTVSAATKEPVSLKRSNQPIQIKSDHLSTDSSSKTATFSGRVTAQQGDLAIVCDQLIVRYAGKGNDIDEVDATGNVRINQGERQAFAGKAVYDNKSGLIRLEQNPRVQQAEDSIVGESITYYVDELKSVVVGGPSQRVEAVIRPGGERNRGPGIK